MQPYYHKPKRLKIPLYDIGTIVAGFYIGYNEGKGVDVKESVEYLTKYGPTVLAISMTPLLIKATNSLGKWINKKTFQEFMSGDLEIKLENGNRKYKYLTESQKQNIAPIILSNISNLESKLQHPKYLRPTLKAGVRTAIETIIGYTAGRAYSYIS